MPVLQRRPATLVFVVLALLIPSAETSAALMGPGDIAFVGYSAGNPTALDDIIVFAALADITNGQKIFFSDEELPIDNDEGTIQWQANQNISAGSVIRIDFNSSANSGTATFGTVIETESGFALGTGQDQIIAYLGSSGSPTAFLSALDYNNNVPIGDLTGTGLAYGLNAVDLRPASEAHGEYTGTTTFSSVEAARLAFNDPNNWSTDDTGNLLPFDVSIGAGQITLDAGGSGNIPEPHSWAVFLGLGLALFIARRRRKQLVSDSLL